MTRRQKQLFSLLAIVALGGLSLLNPQWLGSQQLLPERLTPQPGYYSVSQIYDGDTIGVLMNGQVERVRLIGVDTPETQRPGSPVECFGLAASDYTRRQIGPQSVRLASDPQSTNRDRYQRLLRYVFLPDGRLLNAEIIRGGYGFAYTYFPFDRADEFRSLQSEAMANSRGLWAGCEVTTDQRGQQHTAPAD